jgi:antitoxin (DNA-binding transcriptional repressor) of toxin-antitoxin stability system
MDMGVRELKAKLSAALQRAAAGEVITVTDRGRPIATIGPPLGAIDLNAAAEAGWLAPASAVGLQAVPRAKARMPVLDSLAEDRGE